MLHPWNVDKLNTNTQYLLGELGRRRLVRDSEIQGHTKWFKGNIKLNPLRTKPTPVLQCTFSQVYLSAYVTIQQVTSCHEEFLYFQLLIPPKRFDIFPP